MIVHGSVLIIHSLVIEKSACMCCTPKHESVSHALYWFSIELITINRNKIEESKLEIFFYYFGEFINLLSLMDLFLIIDVPPPCYG
jgi:hypothetical protein